MKTLYTAKATTVGGRSGKSETDDKKLSFQLASPGSGKDGTNPEQLFACGYSACFGSAVEHVAKLQKVETGEVSVQATVNLNQSEEGFSITAALNVNLPKLDTPTAQKLVEEAHNVCPYSKATRGNIQVSLSANGQSVALAT